MKIIIDECVPSIVKKGLPARGIVTVQEAGWAGVKNGQLLKLVAADFDVFITSDKSLRRQQYLTQFDLAIILLPRRCCRRWMRYLKQSAGKIL